MKRNLKRNFLLCLIGAVLMSLYAAFRFDVRGDFLHAAIGWSFALLVVILLTVRAMDKESKKDQSSGKAQAPEPIPSRFEIWLTTNARKLYPASVLALFLALFVILLVGPFKKSDPEASVSNAAPISTETESATESEPEIESETEITRNTEEQVPELTEEAKQAILEADSAIWSELLKIDAAYDDFVEALNLFNENYDTVAFNDAAKEMASIADSSGAIIDAVEYEGIEAYRLEADIYAELFQYVGEYIQQYFETPNEAYLNEATDLIEKRNSSVLSVVAERMKFLSAAGLSDEEINELMSSDSDALDTETTSSELSTLSEKPPVSQENTDGSAGASQENTDGSPSGGAQDAEPAADAGSADGSGNGNNFDTYDNADQQQTSASYVLNTSTKKIHYPSCRSVRKIAPQNYAESNQSIDELQAQGYTTCGNCF